LKIERGSSCENEPKVEIWKGLEERIGIGEDPGGAEVKQG